MSLVGINKLLFIRGDDVNRKLTFTDKNGDPINITGWTVSFTMKKNTNDGDDDAIYKVDIVNHLPETGSTNLSILKSVTKDWPIGCWSYDIQIEKANGIVRTILLNSAEVIKDVTRRI